MGGAVGDEVRELQICQDDLVTIETKRSDPALGARLYAASRYHAGRARALAASTDEYVQIDAAAHAGAAVELMAKALLADFDVRLLHGGGLHHALLDIVAGNEGIPARRSISKTTVGAVVAIELAGRLVPGCHRHEAAAKQVASVRNGAVHLAEAPSIETLREAVAGMEAFTDAAARHLHGSSHNYWGVHFEEVQKQQLAADEKVLKDAKEKVAAARSRFDEMVGRLSAELRAPVLAELRTREGIVGDETDEVSCPACDQEATAAWDWEVDVEEEFPGEYMYSQFLAPAGLGCPVCGLRLDASETLALGIDLVAPSHESDEDFDLDSYN